MGLAAARIDVRAFRVALTPALVMEMVCCSMASWMAVWSCWSILSNSSIQHTPWGRGRAGHRYKMDTHNDLKIFEHVHVFYKSDWSSGEFLYDHGMTTGFNSQPMVHYRIFKVYTNVFKNILTCHPRISGHLAN